MSSRLAGFALLLLATSLLAPAASAGEVVALQDETPDPRTITYENNIAYFYGNNDDGGAWNSWPMWTHAVSADSNSDDSITEANSGIPGNPNEGGGNREFTFTSEFPSNESTPLNNEIPVEGFVTLSIFCPIAQDTCSKQMTIFLRLGNRDLDQQVVQAPDENNRYNFSFHLSIDEIPAGESLGLRISFAKPGQLQDGYQLYFGNGNFQMEIPIVAPYEESVPGLEDEGPYVSPYATEGAGFKLQSTQAGGVGGLIMWLAISLLILIGGFAIIPNIPLKEVGILFAGIGLLVSMFLIPLITGPVAVATAVDINDPDVYTIDELAQLEEREGTFLGDDLVTETEFKVWIEYDEAYVRTVNEIGEVHALGFEEHAEVLSDSETSRRGKEFVQLYFSFFATDLHPGQALIVHVKLENYTDNEGVTRTIPQYANPNDGADKFVDLGSELGGRWVIPTTDADGNVVTEIVGESIEWQYYPLGLFAVGFLILLVSYIRFMGVGLPSRPENAEADASEAEEDDFDFDDSDFEDEEEDELDDVDLDFD